MTREALNRVKNYVEIGIKEGATLAVDGRNFKMQGYENGFYMGGCLFDNVTKDMRIYKEEIFGPVLSVVRAHDYKEALSLPSDHDYGNGVAIFTRDGDAARDFAAKVNVGMVGINVPIPVPIAYYTFGGVFDSDDELKLGKWHAIINDSMPEKLRWDKFLYATCLKIRSPVTNRGRN